MQVGPWPAKAKGEPGAALVVSVHSQPRQRLLHHRLRLVREISHHQLALVHAGKRKGSRGQGGREAGVGASQGERALSPEARCAPAASPHRSPGALQEQAAGWDFLRWDGSRLGAASGGGLQVRRRGSSCAVGVHASGGGRAQRQPQPPQAALGRAFGRHGQRHQHQGCSSQAQAPRCRPGRRRPPWAAAWAAHAAQGPLRCRLGGEQPGEGG